MMEETNIIERLAALAQPTRLRAFRALVEAGEDGLSSGALAALGDVPWSTLSSHLGRLEAAGLVRSRRASRNIIYVVDIEGMRELLTYLAQNCCGGRPDLCGDLVQSPGAACLID